MKSATQIFVDKLVEKQKEKILSVEILGSREGENDLTISDIDFLILCNDRADIDSVFDTALQLQKQIFGVKPTRVNGSIQKFFLGSNSYNGVHLIILGRDELDSNFRPNSFRLKLMTKLVGINLFLYEIKQNHSLLYGKNFVDKIRIEQPNFSEKITCFIFPAIVLLLAFPSIIFSRRTFKIWCFKTIKYHTLSLRALAEITGQNFADKSALLNTAKNFRYKPDEYSNSILFLYFRVWAEIFGNLRLLFSKNKTSKISAYERN